MANLPQQITLTSGSSYTLTDTNYLINWNSAVASNKTVTIPSSSGSLTTVVVVDIKGNAGNYSITITPVSGSIIGSNVISSNYGSITLLDTKDGWVSVVTPSTNLLPLNNTWTGVNTFETNVNLATNAGSLVTVGLNAGNNHVLDVQGVMSAWYQFILYDDLGSVGTNSTFLQGEGGDLYVISPSSQDFIAGSQISMYAPEGISLSTAGSISFTTGGGSGALVFDGGGNLAVNNSITVTSPPYSGSAISIGDSGTGHPGVQTNSQSLALQGGGGWGVDFYVDGGNTLGMSLDVTSNLSVTGNIAAIGSATFQSLTVFADADIGGNFNANEIKIGGTTVIDPSKNGIFNSITLGGVSSSFVKGDGSLDSTTYLPYKSTGTAVLVSGTKAVTISGLTTSNHAIVTVGVAGGTMGNNYKAVCTTNTLTITAISTSGSTVTTDTSTLNYIVY